MSILTKESVYVVVDCPKHGKQPCAIVKTSFGSLNTETSPECPVCVKERSEAEKSLALEKREKQRLIRLWQSMNIEPRFYGADFENFDAYNDELSRHLQRCREFAKKPAGQLVLLGENGNGKTHLAVSILKKTGGIIYLAYEIGILLRQSYGGKAKLDEAGIFEKLCGAPLLVIDEAEKIKDSEAKRSWLSYVVNKRYNSMLPVIFIANCHTQSKCGEAQKPCPRCIEYHLENDVLSRIIEDGIIMNFTNSDYRVKIREKNNTA
jgi:DNA replication protein DnaC